MIAAPMGTFSIPPRATLRLSVISSEASHRVEVRILIALPDGSLTNSSMSLLVVTAQTVTTMYAPAPVGTIQGMVVFDSNAAQERGVTYAVLSLGSGLGAVSEFPVQLWAGYVSGQGGASMLVGGWEPSSTVDLPPRSVLIASPPVTTEIGYENASMGFHAPILFSFLFTASATVGPRVVWVLFTLPGGLAVTVGDRTSVTAGQAVRMTVGAFGVYPADTAAVHYFAIPPMGLPVGSTVSTSTGNLQVGDAFTGISIVGTGFQQLMV